MNYCMIWLLKPYQPKSTAFAPALDVSMGTPPGFPPVMGKPVHVAFDGGRMTSDSGILLLARVGQQLGIAQLTRLPEEDWGFVLVEGEAGLELCPPGELGRRGVGARFPPDRPLASGARVRHPLEKAFGKKVDLIYDATAGLGAVM